MVEVSLVKENKVICSLDSFLEVFKYCCHPGCANQAIIKHHTIGLTLIVNWKCLYCSVQQLKRAIISEFKFGTHDRVLINPRKPVSFGQD